METNTRLIDKVIRYIEDTVCITTLTMILLLTVFQVVLRYLFASSIKWAEEIITFLLVVLSMFGAARATRNGRHTEMDGLVLSFPKPVRIIVNILTSLATLAYLVIIVLISGQFTLGATMRKSFMLRIPMIYLYASMPIGGAFMVYEFAKSIKTRVLKTRMKEES